MKTKMLTLLVLASVVFMSPSVLADGCAKYTVDGDLSDWGVNLAGDWSQNATWVPDSGVQFAVEDNRNPMFASTYTGVHIRGTGSSYVFYNEPKIQYTNGVYYVEPSGGEAYDIEAIYFDSDDDCLYYAIVNSQPPAMTGNRRPGDLALNFDNDYETGEYGYEYGVKTGDNYLDQFGVYSYPDWKVTADFTVNAPSYFDDAEAKEGDAQGAYVNLGKSDYGENNYVIELAIPRSMVGNPENPTLYSAHVSEGCGNDHIPVPEFAFFALPVALMGLILAFSFRAAKRKAA